MLGSVDLAVPFLVRAGLLGSVFVVGLAAVHDIGFTPRTTTVAALPGDMSNVLQPSMTVGGRARPARLLMIVSLIHGAFLMWAFYAWQPYFLDLLGRDTVWGGRCHRGADRSGDHRRKRLVDYFTRFCGRRTTLLLAAAAVLALAAAGVGLVDSFGAAVVLFLVAMGAIGVVAPVQQTYLHAVVPRPSGPRSSRSPRSWAPSAGSGDRSGSDT